VVAEEDAEGKLTVPVAALEVESVIAPAASRTITKIAAKSGRDDLPLAETASLNCAFNQSTHERYFRAAPKALPAD
jgi:hypothetical protein